MRREIVSRERVGLVARFPVGYMVRLSILLSILSWRSSVFAEVGVQPPCAAPTLISPQSISGLRPGTWVVVIQDDVTGALHYGINMARNDGHLALAEMVRPGYRGHADLIRQFNGGGFAVGENGNLNWVPRNSTQSQFLNGNKFGDPQLPLAQQQKMFQAIADDVGAPLSEASDEFIQKFIPRSKNLSLLQEQLARDGLNKMPNARFFPEARGPGSKFLSPNTGGLSLEGGCEELLAGARPRAGAPNAIGVAENVAAKSGMNAMQAAVAARGGGFIARVGPNATQVVAHGLTAPIELPAYILMLLTHMDYTSGHDFARDGRRIAFLADRWGIPQELARQYTNACHLESDARNKGYFRPRSVTYYEIVNSGILDRPVHFNYDGLWDRGDE